MMYGELENMFVIVPNAFKEFTAFKYDPQFKVTAEYKDEENDVLYVAEQFVTLDVGGVNILDSGV